MDCREFADRLDEFFEGLVPPAARGAMEGHRAGCDGCRGSVVMVILLGVAAAVSGVSDRRRPCANPLRTMPRSSAKAITT